MDYEKQATDFLAAHGLTFSVHFVGNDCPMGCADAIAERDMNKLDTFPRRTHIHGKHYRCTIKRADGIEIGFDFWNSYQDESINWAIRNRFNYQYAEHYKMEKAALRVGRKIQVPTAYDLLASITKNDPGTFNNFCSDFGYDTDSRRAEETYKAVVKEWDKVNAFFTAEQIEQLQEIS